MFADGRQLGEVLGPRRLGVRSDHDGNRVLECDSVRFRSWVRA